MQNFDKAIEKYRRELIEFSKMNKVHTPEIIESEIEPIIEETEEEIVQPVMAEIVEDVPILNKGKLEPYKDYEDFLSKNSSTGQMKIQVTIAGTIPLPNAQVTVSVDLPDGEKELYSGYTDIDGIIDPVTLPAPPVSLSFDENSTTVPYSVYNVKVTHPDFSPAEFKNAPVFDSIKSIQSVILVPNTENGDIPGSILVENEPMNLYGGEN